MMSIMCAADLPGHDSAFERGEEAVHGLVLVDRFQLGEILPSEPEEHVLVDPHAMGQPLDARPLLLAQGNEVRAEEHTSELQSLMRTSYAVFSLKKKGNRHT